MTHDPWPLTQNPFDNTWASVVNPSMILHLLSKWYTGTEIYKHNHFTQLLQIEMRYLCDGLWKYDIMWVSRSALEFNIKSTLCYMKSSRGGIAFLLKTGMTKKMLKHVIWHSQ